METIKTAVIGATGYTGLQLVELLDRHPEAEIAGVSSESAAGTSLRDQHPLAPDLTLIPAAEVPFREIDVVFLCLPHTQSAPVAGQALAAGCKVVDLSADLRLRTAESFEAWYHTAHPAPGLLPVPYGLPEVVGREPLMGADCIANPGCYATSILLALAPLARSGLILEGTPLIADCKSGVTGAGRKAKASLLFGEVHGNFYPYSIGRAHRHIGEVEQELAALGLAEGHLIFSPHLLPTDRGILSTIYVQVADQDGGMTALEEAYREELLVDVLPRGEIASLAHVVRTPRAVLSLTAAADSTLIIVSVLDNLMKGAASQAVQNFNLMVGLPETTGLIPATHLVQVP
jgi:N-acetyl-gamma-glutamyl-phosphate reductase